MDVRDAFVEYNRLSGDGNLSPCSFNNSHRLRVGKRELFPCRVVGKDLVTDKLIRVCYECDKEQ